MRNGAPSAVYRQFVRALREGTFTGLSDREVLERYVESRDEAAFDTIVTRHGPMVLNVCRQLLRDRLDIEDAFQAVFLALIRKAGSLRVDDSLGPWLYTVAHRVSLRARVNRSRQGIREQSSESLLEWPAVEPEASSSERFETTRVIHEELGRLPERLRAPLVLCYLQGATHEMAARQIRCPVGTVRSRLARGRAVLRKRIARRGLTLSVGVVASILESAVKGGSLSPLTRTPVSLKTSLVQMATRTGTKAACAVDCVEVSKRAIELGEGVLTMMRIKSLTMTAAGIASVGILLAIAGTAASLAADRPDESRPVTEPRTKVRVERVEDKKPARETVNRTYSVGDLVSSAFPIGTTSSQEVVETNGVTMGPLMDLISSTIEPGSWRTFDERGREIFPAPLSADQLRDRERLPGSITPFYLTLSLIIRAPENTQKKVADYLQKLRAVVDARDNTSKVDPELYKRHLKARLAQVGSVKSAEPQTTATPNVATKSINTAATPSLTPKPSSGARSRVDQLLEELRQEIAKLPKE